MQGPALPGLAFNTLIKEFKPCVSSFLLLPLPALLSASPLARRKPLKKPPKLQTLLLPMLKLLLTMPPPKLAKPLKLLATLLKLLAMRLKLKLLNLRKHPPSNYSRKRFIAYLGAVPKGAAPLL